MDELWSLIAEWNNLGWYLSTYLPGWGYSMGSIEWQAYAIR